MGAADLLAVFLSTFTCDRLPALRPPAFGVVPWSLKIADLSCYGVMKCGQIWLSEKKTYEQSAQTLLLVWLCTWPLLGQPICDTSGTAEIKIQWCFGLVYLSHLHVLQQYRCVKAWLNQRLRALCLAGLGCNKAQLSSGSALCCQAVKPAEGSFLVTFCQLFIALTRKNINVWFVMVMCHLFFAKQSCSSGQSYRLSFVPGENSRGWWCR